MCGRCGGFMETEDKSLQAANEIADQFTQGFCNDRMINDFSEIIKKYFSEPVIIENQKILKLESIIDFKNAEIESKRLQIDQKNIWLYDREQKFLDQAAIAAMQSLVINGCKVCIGGRAYAIADDMLAEKKRLREA